MTPTPLPTRTWLKIAACDCGSERVTHIVFVNTPSDAVYIVGSCRRCYNYNRFTGEEYGMPLGRFMRAIDKMTAAGVSEEALPHEVAERLDPTLRSAEVA